MNGAPDGRRTRPRVRVAHAGRRIRDDRGLAGIAGAAAVGLVLRVVTVVVASRTPQGLVDPARYFRYAEAIGRGEGMVEVLSGGQPTAYFPPGYPYFLGSIQAVLTHTPLPDDLPLFGGLAQAVVGTISIVVVGLLARRLASPAAGVVAAAILALYPNQVLHTATLLSETLSIALLLGFLLALVPPGLGRWPGPLAWRRLVGAGFLLGGLLLVRPVTVGVAGAAVVAWLVAGEGWRRTATRTAAVVGVALLCLAPWTVRNLVRMDSFVLLSTNTGDNLCIGHAPTAGGGFDQPLECMTGTGVQGGVEDEVSSDQEKTRRALRFIREDWRREPGLAVNRFEILVERDDDSVRALQSYGEDPWAIGDHEALVGGILNGTWFVVGGLGAVGLVRLAWSRKAEQLLLPLSVLAVLAAPLLTFADSRFKAPIVPLLAVGAAALLTRSGPAEREGA